MKVNHIERENCQKQERRVAELLKLRAQAIKDQSDLEQKARTMQTNIDKCTAELK